MPRKRTGSRRQRTNLHAVVARKKAALLARPVRKRWQPTPAERSARRTRTPLRSRSMQTVFPSAVRTTLTVTRAPYELRKRLMPLPVRRQLAKIPNIPSWQQLARRGVLKLTDCRREKSDRRNAILRSGRGGVHGKRILKPRKIC